MPGVLEGMFAPMRSAYCAYAELVRHALVDARERGCAISTLQATRIGEPTYARLGYRTHGRVNMWERRRS